MTANNGTTRRIVDALARCIDTSSEIALELGLSIQVTSATLANLLKQGRAQRVGTRQVIAGNRPSFVYALVVDRTPRQAACSARQLGMLAQLKQHGPRSTTQLARALGVAPQMAIDAAYALERAGKIERHSAQAWLRGAVTWRLPGDTRAPQLDAKPPKAPKPAKVPKPHSERHRPHPRRDELLALLRARGPMTTRQLADAIGRDVDNVGMNLFGMARHRFVVKHSRAGRTMTWALPGDSRPPVPAPAAPTLRPLPVRATVVLRLGNPAPAKPEAPLLDVSEDIARFVAAGGQIERIATPDPWPRTTQPAWPLSR